MVQNNNKKDEFISMYSICYIQNIMDLSIIEFRNFVSAVFYFDSVCYQTSLMWPAHRRVR